MTSSSPRALRIVLALLTGSALLLFLMPLLGILFAAPWSRLLELLASGPVHDALLLSLVSSLGAVAIAVVLGMPLAHWLASGESVLRQAARIVVTLPIVLPPIVAGIALLLAFGRQGLVGRFLADWFGLAIPFSTTAIVVAAAYMGLPFFVLSAEAGLRALDRRYLHAAAALGAGPWRRGWYVTIPMIAPALRTGALLCWARALGEFCATQMFAGNLAGETRTLPLACAVAMEVDPELAIGLSLVLATSSIVVLAILRRGWILPR